MNILSIEKITKYHGEKMIFDEADFYLEEGERVGIIGINGTGKSTLLNILEGTEEPDAGRRTVALNTVIGYMEQNPMCSNDTSLLDFIFERFTEEERWQMEIKAKTLLTHFGFTSFDKCWGELSGGEKKRAALVRVLVMPCDILMLDEPTNHLDAEMNEWLEQYLKDWKKTLVIVTHDRYFLDAVTNRIAEVNRGKITSYHCSYSGYIEKKAELEELADAAERKHRNLLRTELEWLKRGARARSTKQKAHIARIEEMQNHKAAIKDRAIELSSVSSRMGRTTIELNNISKAYKDKKLINDFSYIFLKNDRVGIIGSNGCGKTTLMKIIADKIKPDSGSCVRGQTVKIGYYTQEISNDPSDGLAYMKPDKKVIDYIRDTAEYVVTKDGSVSASVMLDRFLFPPQMQHATIEKLSGGEKRRLYLLRILMEAPNFLLLDEPTNDLDIQTMTILEDYIDSFDGIVVTVSHDRYYLDRMVNRIFAFEENGEICQYEGGFSDYFAAYEQKLEDKKAQKAPKAAKKPEQKDYKSGMKKKLRFSYKEEKEYAVIEEEISSLEAEIADTDKLIEASATDFVKLNELSAKKEKLEEELGAKMDRWVYLEELAARINESE